MTTAQWRATAGEVAAGIGLGLLVGVLLGLSTSELVGSVVAVLAALLGAFLGLSKTAASSASGAGRQWRIAGFGFACTLGALLGLSVRTHAWLSDGPKADVDRWVAAGAPLDKALAYVAYQRLGIVPSGERIEKLPQLASTASVLFASHDAGECAKLGQRRFDSGATRLAAMRNAGGSWQRFAGAAATAPPAQLEALLQAGYLLVCEE